MTSVDDLLAQSAWMRGLARRLVRDASEADDLVQDACLVFLARPTSERPVRRSWLAGVLRNLARMRARSATRRRGHESRAAPPGATPSAADVAARFDLQRRVAARVAALPEPLRTAILLRYFEQWDTVRIAEETGVPASTVRSRLARARELLRAGLDDDHDGDTTAWCLALLPWIGPPAPGPVAAPPRPSIPTAAATGGAILGTATKLGVAAAAALLIGWWVVHDSSTEETTRRPDARIAADAEPTASRRRADLAARERGADDVATPDRVDGPEGATPPAPPPDPLSVRTAGGDPVAGSFVLVAADGRLLAQGTIDAAGAAQLPRTDRPHSLIVAASGHPPLVQARDGAAGAVQVTLPAGAAIEGLLRVDGSPPGRPVLLRLDVASSPLVGVPADAAALEHLDAAGFGPTAVATWCDAQGRFAFAGLDASSVRALRPPRGTALAEGTGEAGGESMRITAPDRAVVVEAVTLPVLTGTVVDGRTGEPAAGATVHLGFVQRIGNLQLFRRSSHTTDAEGRFQVALPTREATGAELAIAHADGSGRSPVVLPDPLAPGRNDLGELVLPPLRQVRLVIRDAEGRPVPRAAAVVPGEGYRTSPPTGADGRTSLDVAGRTTIRVGALDHAEAMLEIGPEDDALDVTLAAAGALRVRVVDVDGRPAPGGRVLLRSVPRPFATEGGHPPTSLQGLGGPQLVLTETGETTATFVFRTDASGRVTISGLATPCTATVLLTDAVGVVHATRDIRLDAPRSSDVELRFARPAVTLEGRLVGPDGSPAEGVAVSLEHAADALSIAAGDARDAPRAETAADGRFAIRGVRSTAALLVARRAGRAVNVRRLDIGDDARDTVDLGDWRLDAGRTVMVRLVDADGRPFADAHVTVLPEGATSMTRSAGICSDLRQVEPGVFALVGLPRSACTLLIARGAVQLTEPLAADVEEARFVVR